MESPNQPPQSIRKQLAGSASSASQPQVNPSALQAAETVAIRHGIQPDRREILQDGHTLVVRLTDSLVARIVSDIDGPRQGKEWFARETAVAAHLTRHGAPVIPLHPGLPATAQEEGGYTLNFWQYVTATREEPAADAIGASLHQCHRILASLPTPLPHLAILHESLALLDSLQDQNLLPATTIALLRDHLTRSLDALADLPHQPLHGDAHRGNLMMTTEGLLWTDWEDAFSGPVEWDLASIIWNVRLLDDDQSHADAILTGYRNAGGNYVESVLQQCLAARAAVMSAWYPVLYPDPSPERTAKLRHRLDWLEKMAPTPLG